VVDTRHCGLLIGCRTLVTKSLHDQVGWGWCWRRAEEVEVVLEDESEQYLRMARGVVDSVDGVSDVPRAVRWRGRLPWRGSR
jgi:hypothetical protein